MIYLVAGAVTVLVLIVLKNKMSKVNEKRRKKEVAEVGRKKILEYLNDSAGIEQSVAAVDGTAGIGLNWAERSLLVVKKATIADSDNGQSQYQEEFEKRVVKAHEIVRCQVIEDSYVKTNKTGGKRKYLFRKVELKVNLSDCRSPVLVVVFFSGDTPADDDVVLEARELAVFWEGVVVALCHGQAPVAVGRAGTDGNGNVQAGRSGQDELSEEERRRERAKAKAARLLAELSGSNS